MIVQKSMIVFLLLFKIATTSFLATTAISIIVYQVTPFDVLNNTLSILVLNELDNMAAIIIAK